MTAPIFDEAIFDEVVFDGLSRAVLHAFLEVTGGANAISFAGAVGTGARSFDVAGGACAITFEVTA